MTAAINRFTSNYLQGSSYKNRMSELNGDLQQLSKEIQSGQKYKQYYDVEKSTETKEILNTSSAIKQTKSTSDSLDRVLNRLEFGSEKMTMMIDEVTKSIGDIIKTANSQNLESSQLKHHAKEMLSFLKAALNSRSNTDGTYFFSGNAVTTKPVDVDLITSADIHTPYYTGGNENLTYVYKDQLESYGVTANEAPFQALIKSYQELYHDTDTFDLSELRSTIQDAKNQIIFLREKIGEEATKVKTLKDSADRELLDLKEKSSHFLETDPTEKIVDIGKNMTRLNAIAYVQKLLQDHTVLRYIGGQ